MVRRFAWLLFASNCGPRCPRTTGRNGFAVGRFGRLQRRAAAHRLCADELKSTLSLTYHFRELPGEPVACLSFRRSSSTCGLSARGDRFVSKALRAKAANEAFFIRLYLHVSCKRKTLFHLPARVQVRSCPSRSTSPVGKKSRLSSTRSPFLMLPACRNHTRQNTPKHVRVLTSRLGLPLPEVRRSVARSMMGMP